MSYLSYQLWTLHLSNIICAILGFKANKLYPIFPFFLQPENLLVEISPGSVLVKVVDFGDARHIYNNYYIHPMVGNPEFMSPEVISGTPVGLLTDIW